MKSFYIFKDGRRREVEKANLGSQRIHVPHRGSNNEWLETIFEGEEVDGEIHYVETETREVKF